MSTSYFYKSDAAGPVAIVDEFCARKAVFSAARVVLGQHFGGEVASMAGVYSQYAGGVKLITNTDVDVHWRRADAHGYRSLRTAAKPEKGSSTEILAVVRARHQRLLELWEEHCPPSLDIREYWDRLSVNSVNLFFSGGVKFSRSGVAYFQLGFPINEADHAEAIAAKKPSYGWIEGATEITSSEYQAARTGKLEDLRLANG